MADEEEAGKPLYTFGGTTPAQGHVFEEGETLTFQKGEAPLEAGAVTEFELLPAAHALSEEQAIRLGVLVANTLEVLEKDGKLDAFYEAGQEPFWRLMVKKLYSDVFQAAALPRSLIMQSLTYKGLYPYPSVLRGILDDMLATRELALRDPLRPCRCLRARPEEDPVLVHREVLGSVAAELAAWAGDSAMPYALLKAQADAGTFKLVKTHLKQTGRYRKQEGLVKLSGKPLTKMDVSLCNLRYGLVPRLQLLEKTLERLRDSITHRTLADCLRAACLKKVLRAIDSEGVRAALEKVLELQARGQALTAFQRCAQASKALEVDCERLEAVYAILALSEDALSHAAQHQLRALGLHLTREELDVELLKVVSE